MTIALKTVAGDTHHVEADLDETAAQLSRATGLVKFDTVRRGSVYINAAHVTSVVEVVPSELRAAGAPGRLPGA